MKIKLMVAMLALAGCSASLSAAEVLDAIVIKGKAATISSDEAEAVISPSEVPLGISVSGSELASVPGSGGDSLRAISSLPGVAIAGDDEGEVAIRGARPENNLYYIDFLPTGYLFHMTGTSVVNSDLLRRFDFLPAGYGVRYQGGTGGVLDIQTRAPKHDRQALLEMSLLEAGLLVEGSVGERQSAYLSARMSYYDLLLKDVIEDQEDEDFSIVQLPKYFDYRGKYHWDINDSQSLDVLIDGADDEAEFVLSEDSDAALQDPVVAGDIAVDFNYHRQGVLLSGQRSRGANYQLGIANRLDTTAIQQGQVGSLDLDVSTLTFKGEYDAERRGLHQLRWGGELERVTADYNAALRESFCTEFDADCRLSDAALVAATDELSVWGRRAFIEDNILLGDKGLITAGLGFSQDDYLEQNHIAPRLRLQWFLDNGMQLTTVFGRYHEFPEFEQVEKTFGNPELEYLQADHYVVGVEHERDDGWFWKVEGYHKEMTNLVTSDAETNYSNEGEGTARGLELFIKKAFDQQWSGWLAASASDAQRTDLRTGESFDFDYDQPLIVNLVVKRQMNPRWAVSSKLRFNRGAPYTPVTGAEADADNAGSYRAIYGDLNSERLPNYFRADVRVDYQRRPKSWKIFAELLNATMNDNVSGYEYSADYSEREEVEQIPIFLNFGLKLPLR